MALWKQTTFFILFSFLLISCAGQQKITKTPTKKKAELYYDYGTKNLVDKNYTKALANLKIALSYDKKNSKVHNNLGMAYFFKKDINSSLKHLKIAIDLDPKNIDAKNNLASIYFYKKKYKKAYTQYLSILDNLEYGQHYRTYYNLALIDLKFKRNTIALRRLNKSIKENPNYCPAHYQLGLYSARQKDYMTAVKHFTDGTKGNCFNSPAPHYQKAKALITLGENEKALFTLRNIMEQFPKTKYAILAKRKLRALNISEFRRSENAKRNSRQPINRL